MSTAETPVAMDAVPIEVTPAEQNLLRSFRAMDDRSQGFIGRTAEGMAGKRPRRTPPSLRIVKGGQS
jgi:hypothetical protein